MKSNRALFIVTAFVIFCIVVLFGFNLYQQANKSVPSEKYLSLQQVSGIEIIHNELPYTLNFEQQTQLISFLNQAESFTGDLSVKKSPLEITKIIIYLFDKSTIEITPLAFIDHRLIFKSTSWNNNMPMQEGSHGQVENLLVKTYDP